MRSTPRKTKSKRQKNPIAILTESIEDGYTEEAEEDPWVQFWGIRGTPKGICAIADENGNALCGKREGEWSAIAAQDSEIVSCVDCLRAMGY